MENKIETFNLQTALEQPERLTYEGQTVFDWSYNPMIKNINICDLNGFKFDRPITDPDLGLLPEKKQYWVNIYRASDGCAYPHLKTYLTKEQAIEDRLNYPQTTVLGEPILIWEE